MRHKAYLLAGVIATLVAFSPTASASLQLTLSSGATTVTINDGGAGDLSPFSGQITFIGMVGTWSMNVTTGTVGTNPLIDLNSVDTLGIGSGTGANALSLKFSSTGYSTPFAATFDAAVGGTLAVTHGLSYSAYVDTTNALNGVQTLIGSTLSFSNPSPPGVSPLPFAGITAGGFAAANTPYSLTQVVTISGTKGGTTSFDASIEAVPEPATVALLGGVLLAAFGTLRRKARRA